MVNEGLILIDKPSGLTSHDVVRRLRRIYGIRKVGHAGTLDPLATGVLPVAIGSATKLLQFLVLDDKSYRVRCRLGVTTDSLDADGEVMRVRPVPELTEATVVEACQRFSGEIEQIPPMHSAIKQNGRPLYQLAHQGQVVEREPRRVRIDRLDLITWTADELELVVDCSKGTYVRTLVADIGEVLGCGAHVTALRRLRCGDFRTDECVSLEQLQEFAEPGKALIKPLDVLRQVPLINLSADAVRAIGYGIPPAREQVTTCDDLEAGQLVRLQAAEELLAVARFQPQRTVDRRGDFELLRVFLSH